MPSPTGDAARPVRRGDELVFPFSKNAFAQYWEEEGRPRTLRLFHRDREISFDDPALFPFGEALVLQSRFPAEAAAGWGRLGWPRARALLEQLVAAGVLRHSDEQEDLADSLSHEERDSPLPPAPCHRPMTWDESEAILRLVSGRPLETGYLELVVPVFRVAHMYLDSDDRQVGEANVFPPLMRLDRPTTWRTCPYSGTRYQTEKPMNVTALRMMRRHWRQMMAIVRRVSDSYKARFPAVARRGWTVGDIERLTVCVLALPTYLMVRRDGRVENGRLHPALSSAYRLTDGPRTVMHHMVFAPFGRPRSGDTPMTGAELHAYAERNYLFHTTRAVCAGPPAMIDDLLAVMLDGEDPKGGWPAALDPEVDEALGQIEPAIDYSLMGLQAYAAVFSVYPASTATRTELRRILLDWKGPESPGLAALREGLDRLNAQAAGAAGPDEREARLAAYDELYRHCGFGLTGRVPAESLSSRFEAPSPLPAETIEKLALAFARLLSDLPGSETLCAELAACVARFLGFVQAALQTALDVQARINTLLGREAPAEPFTGRDLTRYVAFRKGGGPAGGRPQPFLADALADLLGIAIEIAAGQITIADRPAQAAA